MRRHFLICFVMLCGVGKGLGQAPEPRIGPNTNILPAPVRALPPRNAGNLGPATKATPSAAAAPSLISASRTEKLVRFDPLDAEVRHVGQRWELKAGTNVLKEFTNEADARQALRLVRELKLTQYGAVGSPQPVMEYWLADGKVPQPLKTKGPILEFDRGSLRVEQVQGQWFVRDGQQMLFTFGSHADDARQALEVIQAHGFNQINYVGQPLPAMMYLTINSDPHKALPVPTAFSNVVQKSPSAGDARLALMQVESRQLSVPNLLEKPGQPPAKPGLTNASPVPVQRLGLSWQLVLGKHCLADFGPNEREARNALRTLQNPRFTEAAKVGQPARTMTYFLVNNQTLPPGQNNVTHTLFRAENLSVRQVEGQHVLCDGNQPILEVGPDGENARQVLQVIQAHRFNRITRVGSSAEGLSVLGRDR